MKAAATDPCRGCLWRRVSRGVSLCGECRRHRAVLAVLAAVVGRDAGADAAREPGAVVEFGRLEGAGVARFAVGDEDELAVCRTGDRDVPVFYAPQGRPFFTPRAVRR